MTKRARVQQFACHTAQSYWGPSQVKRVFCWHMSQKRFKTLCNSTKLRCTNRKTGAFPQSLGGPSEQVGPVQGWGESSPGIGGEGIQEGGGGWNEVAVAEVGGSVPSCI